MSRILQLRDQIASIPDKDSRKELVGTLKAMTEKAGMCANKVEAVAGACTAMASLDDATFVSAALQATKAAAKYARQMRKHLESGATTKKLDTALTEMGEQADKATKLVDKGWSELIESCVRKYQPLNAAAERAGLPGAPGIAKAHAGITHWRTQMPRSPRDTEMFKATIKQLHHAVEKLGLEGKAGEFLVAAANGRASARDLQNAEVVTFLNQNPGMWGLLRVTL